MKTHLGAGIMVLYCLNTIFKAITILYEKHPQNDRYSYKSFCLVQNGIYTMFTDNKMELMVFATGNIYRSNNVCCTTRSRSSGNFS